jgi:aminoglycoside 6'-N-acetyltransferase
MTYAFRSLTEDDLPMISRWLAEPHVAEWWGDPEQGLREIADAITDIATEPLIVEWDGRPFAYLQTYDPHLEDGHPYQDQPTGTLGMDISIGPPEFLGKGHGSGAIAAFIEQLFSEGVPRVIIDPHPDNARAIRAYEKAGFTAFDTRSSVYGPALMMAIDAPAEES